MKFPYRGGIFFLLFVFLSGCFCSRWRYCEIDCCYPRGKAKILSYIPEDRYSGIQLDLMKDPLGHVAIVEVYTRSLCPRDQDPSFSTLWITVDGKQTPFAAQRFEGNQKLLLPDEASSLLVQSLLDGKSVMLQMIGFQTIYSAVGFSESYVKFCRD